MQKRIEWSSDSASEIANIDAHLAAGWRVVHLTSASTGSGNYIRTRCCAILEPPPGLDSNGNFRL